MQKLTIKNTETLGIEQLDYRYNPDTGALTLTITAQSVIPNGREAVKGLYNKHPELYIPLVQEAACKAVGVTEKEFNAKGRESEEGRYARFLFWKYLIGEKGFNDRMAAEAGGNRNRTTARSAINKMLKEERYMTKRELLWEERFDQFLKEQGLRVRRETTATSGRPTK